MNDFEQLYDVLIIGAGPVGLATAIGLQQRGINNILVVDQTREFRRVGQVVDLLPNGLKALRVIAESAYKAMGIPKTVPQTDREFSDEPEKKRYWLRKNLQGQVTHSVPLGFNDWREKYGEGRISLPWFDLQTNLRNLIDPNLIQINYRCFDYQQTSDEVIVYCQTNQEAPSNPFAHWESGQKTQKAEILPDSTHPQKSIAIRAKLMVAADGINSTMRQILYQNTDLEPWAKPQYSGWAAMGCLSINPVPEVIINQLKTDYFQDQMIISLQNDALMQADPNQDSPRLILINKGEAGLGYLLHFPVPLDKILDQPPLDILNLAIKHLENADFPTVITDLIGLTNLDYCFSRPYYLHAANACDHFPLWSHDRLVLAGDAAHGMPPFSAQGGNQGFEDAAYLVQAIAALVKQHQLDDLDAINQQFQTYEHHRRPFMALMQKAALESHRWTEAEWENYGQQVYGRGI